MKYFILYFIATLLICLIGVYIITLPAIWERFNLANYDKLGNAVNGLTAPVIGLITAILLYSALTRQIEANKQQSEAIRQQTQAIEKQIEANNLQSLGNRQQRI